MTRRAHRLVLLAALAVVVVALCACSPDSGTTVASAYDVAGMLACDPKNLPSALEQLGFSYSDGAPYGSWQTDEPVEGQPECRFNSLMLGGSTPELLNSGSSPEQASFSLQYAPVVSEDEANEIGGDMLERAGFSDPFYTDRVEDMKFGLVNLYRVGRVEGEGPATYWTLWININKDFGYTTYMVSAYTEEVAREATSSPLVEALAVEDA